LADYSEKYIDQCFYTWFDGDRTVGNALIDKLPENEEGKKPGIFTVKRWVEEKGWVERADALDAEVSIQVEKSVIQKRVEMYEKHAKLADELITMGREFLQKQVDGGGLKTENAALRAIELGFQTERVSVGVSDMVRKIGEMTPDQLDNELRKLLGQKQENEFIEGETIESDTVSKETND
jgi:hypothetical protein